MPIIRLLVKEIKLYDEKIEIYFNHTNNNGPDDDSHQALCFYSEGITLENTEGTRMPSEWGVFLLV